MRLAKEIIQFLVSGLKEIEPKSEVYLFGSRTNDNLKGGDIDILWITEKKIPLETIRKFKIQFYKAFGWQKIDIVNYCKTDNDTFKQIALNTAIKL